MPINTMKIFHTDHGVSDVHLAYAESILASRQNGFFILGIPLLEEMPSLSCVLYGPQEGDSPIEESQVFYSVRGDRPGQSRMIDMPARECRFMIVIGEKKDDEVILYTAYGSRSGLAAPREPFDPSLSPEEREECVAFWATHALSSNREGAENT